MYHSAVTHPRPTARRLGLLCVALLVLTRPMAGQTPVGTVAADTANLTVAAAPADPRAAGQQAQADFERFRRMHLPRYRGRVPAGRSCPEPVGLNWCYWYDETNSMPPEPDTIARMRDRLLRTLDSLGTREPGDNWISGQRVRYEVEANRPAQALAVARACRTVGWWCDALAGLSLHEMGRYAEAETTFERVLAAMSERERCEWRDLTPYLDDDTRRVYIRTRCGTPRAPTRAASTRPSANCSSASAGRGSGPPRASRPAGARCSPAPTIRRSA